MTGFRMYDPSPDFFATPTSETPKFDPDSSCSLNSDVAVILSVILLALLCALGLLGNVSVLLAIATTPKLQTTTSVYIANLTLLDLLTCLVLIPAHMIGTLCGSWPLGVATCSIAGHMMWYNTCLALFTLAIIATSRYLLVARPRASFSRMCSRRNVLVSLVSLWASGIVISVLPLQLLADRDLVAISFSTEYASCSVVVSMDTLATSPVVTFVLSLPLILFVLVGCIWIPLQFILTFCTVRRSKRRIQNFELTGCRPHRMGMTREELHLTKILLLIYVLFFLHWMPLILNITLITVFSVPSENMQKHVFTLYLAGSAVNPFIYGWLNDNLRHAIKRLLSKHCFTCRCRRNPIEVIA